MVEVARRALAAGITACDTLRADGDAMADVVDVELNQFVHDILDLRAGNWDRLAKPLMLPSARMLFSGRENYLDPRRVEFSEAVRTVESQLYLRVAVLPWDWTRGVPPGWEAGFAALSGWPEPWDPPTPDLLTEPGRAPDPTLVKQLVDRLETKAWTAYQAGVVLRARLEDLGEGYHTAVVDMELNALTTQMRELRHTARSDGRPPRDLDASAIIWRGQENYLDDRQRPFADAVYDASCVLYDYIRLLDWDWTRGLPPGWTDGHTGHPDWPEPWNPPVPSIRDYPRPTDPTITQPWWDRTTRRLTYRLRGGS